MRDAPPSVPAERRRAQLLARQEAAERIAKEREEVRTLERTIQVGALRPGRSWPALSLDVYAPSGSLTPLVLLGPQEERAFLKQEAREAAKQRAEAELMQRTDTYVRKVRAPARPRPLVKEATLVCTLQGQHALH